MKRILQITLCFVFLAISVSSNAQLINFEETWKAFLDNNKTSNISKLPQPPTNSIDFPKYCLMYANSNFCFNKVGNAQRFMQKIEEIGAEKYKTIPGFVERYEDLGTKIKSYHALAKIWNGYLEDHQISLEKLETVSTARRVCEKGTLAKYTQMETYAYYCMGDVEKAQDIFENYVLQIVDKTNLKISDVKGLEDEVAVFRQLFKVLPVLLRTLCPPPCGLGVVFFLFFNGFSMVSKIPRSPPWFQSWFSLVFQWFPNDFEDSPPAPLWFGSFGFP